MEISIHKEEDRGPADLTYYLSVGHEVEVFTAAFKARMACSSRALPATECPVL